VEDNSQARFRSTRHAKYWCAYHFIWIPKRKDILFGEVAECTKGVIKEIVAELECENLALNVMPDHVHVFILCPPRLAPAYVVKYLKGKSARKILQKFPQLKVKAKHGKLWTREYFVATEGNVTADIVKKYVEEQWLRNEEG